jgi:hypothetical protein
MAHAIKATCNVKTKEIANGNRLDGTNPQEQKGKQKKKGQTSTVKSAGQMVSVAKSSIFFSPVQTCQ